MQHERTVAAAIATALTRAERELQRQDSLLRDALDACPEPTLVQRLQSLLRRESAALASSARLLAHPRA